MKSSCILLYYFKMNWSQMWSRVTLETVMQRLTMKDQSLYLSRVVCHEEFVIFGE